MRDEDPKRMHNIEPLEPKMMEKEITDDFIESWWSLMNNRRLNYVQDYDEKSLEQYVEAKVRGNNFKEKVKNV